MTQTLQAARSPSAWAALALVGSLCAGGAAWWWGSQHGLQTAGPELVKPAQRPAAAGLVAGLANPNLPAAAAAPMQVASSLRVFEAQPAVEPTTVPNIPEAWRIVGVSGTGSNLFVLVEQPGQDQLLSVAVGQRFPDGSKLVALTPRRATVQVVLPGSAVGKPAQPALGKQLIALDL